MGNRDRLTRSKRVRRYAFSWLINLVLTNRFHSNKVIIKSLEYVIKQFKDRETQPTNKFFLSREKLINSIDSELGDKWVGFEFGVAYGDFSKWMLKSGNLARCETWHGFDSFQGLPKAWGDLPEGTFSTNGKPPNLNQKVFQWHVGLVEDTTLEINSLKNRKPLQKMFFVFDMDLYEPTFLVMNRIRRYLQSGDILFFDEAFHSDESRAIRELLLNQNEISVTPIGFTIFGQSFSITNTSSKNVS